MVKLKDNEVKTVEDAIVNAEKNTTGEIVVWFVGHCVDTTALSWFFAFIASVIGSVVLFYGEAYLYLGFYSKFWISVFLFLSALFLGGCAYFCLQFTIVKEFFLKFYSKKYIEKEVRKNAFSIFMQAGLTETKARNGVLIFISLMEHHVEVIADYGIYSKVEDKVWDKAASDIARGFALGNPSQALKAVIDEIGQKLTEYYPFTSQDGVNTNELSNKIRVGFDE